MKISKNSILITGGSAGIGFEIAKSFSEKGNRVLITGRNKEKLEKAASGLRNTTGIVSDVSKEEDVNALVTRITAEFPDLNIVVNNAGNAFLFNLSVDKGAFEKAQAEMLEAVDHRIHRLLRRRLQHHAEQAAGAGEIAFPQRMTRIAR